MTFGLSLICPGQCVNMAEKEAIKYLEDISLNAKYFIIPHFHEFAINVYLNFYFSTQGFMIEVSSSC